MSCNGFNHPPNCNCPWGPGYGRAYRDEAEVPPSRQRHFGAQPSTKAERLVGITIPNAKCQYCQSPVFFYRSPYDGKVFFDSLGPPWPKHQCISSSVIATRTADRPVSTDWESNGWIALLDVVLFEHNKRKNTFRLTGNILGYPTTLYYSSTFLFEIEQARVRRRTDQQFDISFLSYSTLEKTWFEYYGVANTKDPKFSPPPAALIRSPL